MTTASLAPAVLAVAVLACLAATAVATPVVAMVPPSSVYIFEGTDPTFDVCVTLVSGGPVRGPQGWG